MVNPVTCLQKDGGRAPRRALDPWRGSQFRESSNGTDSDEQELLRLIPSSVKRQLSSAESLWQDKKHCKIENLKNVILHCAGALCRGGIISDVNGSVHVMFRNLHHRRERGRKGRECKFQNKAHRTLDIRNNSTPALYLKSTFYS